MPQEEIEELNPQETPIEPQETSEQAPAEEEVPAEQPETKLPEGTETPEGEEAPSIEEQVTISKSEHDQLLKDREDKDNYQKGLLAEKGRKREQELGLSDEPEAAEEPLEATPDTRRDYLSKRADSMAEFKSKIAQLSDEEYSVFKRHLKGSESALLNEKKSWISRKEVNELFVDALEFASFKTKPVKTEVDGDIGSTKTIRKAVSAPRISDRARALQPHTKVNGQVLSLEKIQDMLDRGEIN